jgi:hypothetical protein
MSIKKKPALSKDQKLKAIANSVFIRMTDIEYPFFETTLFRIAFKEVNPSAGTRSKIIEKLKEIGLLRSYQLGLRHIVEAFRFDKDVIEEKSEQIKSIIFEQIKKDAEASGRY